MSSGASSFPWVPAQTLDYTNLEERNALSYEATYGSDTGYTDPIGTQYFGEFDQLSDTSQGTISTLQSTQLPPENLYLHDSENHSWSDHSSFYCSGPIPPSNDWSPDS